MSCFVSSPKLLREQNKLITTTQVLCLIYSCKAIFLNWCILFLLVLKWRRQNINNNIVTLDCALFNKASVPTTRCQVWRTHHYVWWFCWSCLSHWAWTKNVDIKFTAHDVFLELPSWDIRYTKGQTIWKQNKLIVFKSKTYTKGSKRDSQIRLISYHLTLRTKNLNINNNNIIKEL